MTDHVTTRVTGRISAPADRVWEYLSWRGVAKLRDVSLIERFTFEDEAEDVGSVRVLHLKGGSQIPGFVEAISHDERWYVYKPTSLGSLPVRDYTGRLSVEEDGPDRSIVKIESRCIPVGISAADWQKTYTDLETSVIDFVRMAIAAGE